MATPKYIISHSGTKQISDLSEAIVVSTTEGVSAKSNTFTLKFSNPKNETTGQYKYSDVFSIDDDISIKMSQNSEPDERIFDGLVKEWNYENQEKGRLLTIKGTDLKQKLMNIQVFTAYSGNTWTAGSIVENVVDDFINQHVDEQHQINTSKITSTSYILPSGVAYNAKPVYEVVHDMSIDSNTDKGNFISWIQRSGGSSYLRWEPKPTTVDRNISADECFVFNPKKDVYDIINYLHIYAGDDDGGNAIYTYVMNMESISEVGWKEKYWPYPTAVEMARGSGGINLEGTALINRAKEIAETEGKRRLNELSNPRWEADVTVHGTTDYNLANRIFMYAPGIDWTGLSGERDSNGIEYSGYELRIDSITQNFSEKGWQTKLHLKEDVELL